MSHGKKLAPDEAFKLLGSTKHLGSRQNTISPLGEKLTVDYDSKPEQATYPKWLRYTIASSIVIIATSFVFALVCAIQMIIEKAEPSAYLQSSHVEKSGVNALTEGEIESRITDNLRKFLETISIDEKLNHIFQPEIERKHLEDFYTNRQQVDSPLWKILKIVSTSYDHGQVWMVAYRDIKKNTRMALFVRVGDAFLVHWSSTYAYGELTWEKLVLERREKPVQMRAYVLRHVGIYPPGISKETHICLTVENKNGTFSGVAVMSRDAKGADLLAEIPEGARTPVNLTLAHEKKPNGTKILTIRELLHFQWLSQSPWSEQGPVKLSGPNN